MDFQFPIGISLLSRTIMYQPLQRGKFEIGKHLVSTFQLDSNGFPVGNRIPIGIQLTIGFQLVYSDWKVGSAENYYIGLLLFALDAT